jgi:hypothetical protein
MAAGSPSIWYADVPGFLLATDTFYHVLPIASMTLAEQYNAIVRCALYFAVLMVLFRGDTRYLVIPVMAGLLTYAMYEFQARLTRARAARASREGMAVGHRPDDRPCAAPTRDNPFMNLPVLGASQARRDADVCDVRRHDVKKSMERNFRRNLYSDMDDAFDRNTSSRQFYTVPGTSLPNDQAAFARWLYGDMPAKGEFYGTTR